MVSAGPSPNIDIQWWGSTSYHEMKGNAQLCVGGGEGGGSLLILLTLLKTVMIGNFFFI